MAISTTAGARLFVGPVVDPDDIDATDNAAAVTFFSAIDDGDWIEVEEIESLGDFGDVAEIATFASVTDRRTRKFKTLRDGGTMVVVCGRDPLDDGQMALVAAEKTDSNYGFKLIYGDATEGQTASIDYFGGIVLSRATNIGGVGDVTKRTFAVGINTMIASTFPADIIQLDFSVSGHSQYIPLI